ncbi:hypothetical protein [Kribbella sp. NPDC051620]|uniref:hypothetical protein n=1 Tax=Kribbella sp. NPDC051620 TaxID=3364120 RepID=UPI0037A875EE
MPSPQQQLLLIRLDVLDDDVTKVAGAVDRARQRGSKIDEIEAGLAGQQSVTTRIGELKDIVSKVEVRLREPDDIGFDIDEVAVEELGRQLSEVTDGLEDVYKRVLEARISLRQLKATIVVLGDRVTSQSSLDRACGELHTKVAELRAKASAENLDGASLRELWREYEDLLITEGRPLFGEYVDFLGGLTMRDTELDDRVCAMTDALLSGFKSVTGHYLPIPARQAALSNALDSVVKLGFPEWSVWGVPLVAHEVGLALARDPREGDIQGLLDEWTTEASRERLTELFADIFAAYTVGPAYGCAVLLLRLHPHHDEQPGEDEARDVDRARLLLETLRAGSDPDSEFRKTVRRLATMWNDAVITLAAPGAAAAAADAVAPPDESDWLDRYLDAVLAVLDRRGAIERFGHQRWAEGLAQWGKELDQLGQMRGTPGDVLAVLNLAWAQRLETPAVSEAMGRRVRTLWDARKGKGVR